MAGRKKRISPKDFTNQMILDDWKKALQKGLGRKKLHADIATKNATKLLNKIQTRLDGPPKGNYARDRSNTLAVATDLGRICRMLTSGSTVSLGVFTAAFDACRLHPRCPGGVGGGQWCDI
jgi:hypothetical protein